VARPVRRTWRAGALDSRVASGRKLAFLVFAYANIGGLRRNKSPATVATGREFQWSNNGVAGVLISQIGSGRKGYCGLPRCRAHLTGG
jgi:hypothetical protein